MSMVSTCCRPAAALISSASSWTVRTPSAMRANGTPWEPEWVCSRVSQGRSRKARTTRARAPSSRSATPNLDVAVAVDRAPMEPLPVCGLTRRPIGERVGAECTSASRRVSSWGLSALTAMPRARASRSSAPVLAGESRTVRPGGIPAARAMPNSPGLATSAPTPSSRSRRTTGTRGAALTAKVCRTRVSGVVTAAKAACSAATEARIPATSRRAAIGAASVSSPCPTAARTARSRRSAASLADSGVA